MSTNKKNDKKIVKISLTKETLKDLKVQSSLRAGRGTIVTCVKTFCDPA